VEREVRTDAHEQPTAVPVAEVEVVLPDKPGADLDMIAAVGGRVADGHAGALAALEDDGQAEARAQGLVERLDPHLQPHAFWRLHDLDARRASQLLDPAVVVLG
jgi:hypothetical protein